MLRYYSLRFLNETVDAGRSQIERDHEQLVKAIKSGKVKAIMGV
jgi:hypothetical protein